MPLRIRRHIRPEGTDADQLLPFLRHRVRTKDDGWEETYEIRGHRWKRMVRKDGSVARFHDEGAYIEPEGDGRLK